MANRIERIKFAYSLLPTGQKFHKKAAIDFIAAHMGITKKLATDYIERMYDMGLLKSDGWFYEKK